ncbi:MAG: PaaI family thioesterase [Actinobacteria bacterium]|nr:PaaI family thioesterase [Actinomycetota bacterium]
MSAIDPGELEAMDPGGFVGALGLVFDGVEDGGVRAHLDCGPGHHQPYGIVHGGVYATIVETLASISAALDVMPQGKVVVGVSNSTDFLRAHRTGRIDAAAAAIHRGRLQQLWQVTITRAVDGKVVARGQVRLQVLDPDQVGGRASDEVGR